MTTALKRTTILVFILAFVEGVVFGGFVLAEHDAYASDGYDGGATTMMMSVSDMPYDPDVSAESEAASENEDRTEPEEDSIESGDVVDGGDYSDYPDYSSEGYYGEEYYVEEGGLVPYDGSGYYNANLSGRWYSGTDFEVNGGYGCDDDSGYSFTWYSEKVLPGGGLRIPGRHVGDEGYVYDEAGNVCLASDNLPENTVVSIPFGSGTGVVYDSGSGHGNLDVYVSW